LKDGLEAISFNDKDFRNSKYIRLKVLSDLMNNGFLTDKLTWANYEQLARRA